MATLQQIAPTKSHLQAHQQDAGTTTPVDMIVQHFRVIITPGITTMTIEIGTDSADLNLAPIILDIGVIVAVTLAGVTLDPFTDPHATAHYTTEAQAPTTTTKTHHITDPPSTGVSPEMTADQNMHTQQTSLQNPKKIIFQFTSNTLKVQRQEAQTGYN